MPTRDLQSILRFRILRDAGVFRVLAFRYDCIPRCESEGFQPLVLQSLTEVRIPTGIRYEDKRLGTWREVLHALDLQVRCARRECKAKNKKRRRNLHKK